MDKLKHIRNRLKNRENIEQLFKDTHPVDIAEALEGLEPDEITQISQKVDNKHFGALLEELDQDKQLYLLEHLHLEDIVDIFSYMSTDDVTDLLGLMPVRRRKNLLQNMKKTEAEEAEAVQELLGYGPETAGGIMTKEYITLYEDMDTQQALKKLREIAPSTEVIEMIFIVNSRQELVGTIDLRKILTADDDLPLHEIMDKNFVSVKPEMDQEKVARIVEKYDLPVVPVVNEGQKLLGIITFDDIMDVIEEENTEDMLRMVGVEESDRVDSPLGKSMRRRLPWLFINLGTAFLAAFTVRMFEDVIAQVAALAVAMPIVAGMGGNAGTQTLSIVIRSIALGELDIADNWKIILKEVILGLLHGAAIGLITGVVLYLLYGNTYLSLIVLIAMVVTLITASVSGFLIPIGLKALGMDPALSSGIWLTTLTDVFGFFVFLGLARILLVHIL